MKWISLNDIREKYLSFFESKGHLRQPSYPLIPKDDKSLLLINAGMAPLKKFFTGEVTPPRKRMTTCQKCIRVRRILSASEERRATAPFLRCSATFLSGITSSARRSPGPGNFVTEAAGDAGGQAVGDRFTWTMTRPLISGQMKMGVPPRAHCASGQGGQLLGDRVPVPAAPALRSILTAAPNTDATVPTAGVGCDCDRYVEVLEPRVYAVQ